MTEKKIIGTITPDGITATVRRNGREFFITAKNREQFNAIRRMADTVASYPLFGNDNAMEDDRIWFKRDKLRRFRLGRNLEMECGMPADTRWMLVCQLKPGARLWMRVPEGLCVDVYLDYYDGKIPDAILRDLSDGIMGGKPFIMLMPLPGDIDQ